MRWTVLPRLHSNADANATPLKIPRWKRFDRESYPETRDDSLKASREFGGFRGNWRRPAFSCRTGRIPGIHHAFSRGKCGYALRVNQNRILRYHCVAVWIIKLGGGTDRFPLISGLTNHRGSRSYGYIHGMN